MTLRLGINGATLPAADLLTGIQAAAASGFGLYEPRIPALLEMDTPRERQIAAAALADAGLEWLPLNALEDVFSTPLVDLEQTTNELCALAAGFGIHQMIAVPGAIRGEIPLQEGVDILGRLIQVAASHEVTLLYELLGFSQRAFPTLEQARRISGGSGVQLVLDTFHLAVSHTNADAIRQLAAEEIGLVHLSDALTDGGSVSGVLDKDRVLPGEGGLPVQGYIEALAAIGFRGPMSVEVFHERYRSIDPGEGARRAWASVYDLLASAGFDLGIEGSIA